MKWTQLHDQLFVREILLMQPWTTRKASTERGEVWLRIVTSLNSLQSPVFRVNQRSVRDRYAVLEKKYKKKIQDETLASGISCEENEVDLAMDEIVSLFLEADIEHERVATEKKKKFEEEANQAAEMRQQSLESFGETRKRSGSANSEATGTKRKRSSGSDMVLYLREKSEREAELKKNELEIMKEQAVKDHELKENEMKLRKEAMEASQNQNNSMMNQLVELQRVQQQQFMQLMRQQQEQSSCMMVLLNKLTSQK